MLINLGYWYLQLVFKPITLTYHKILSIIIPASCAGAVKHVLCAKLSSAACSGLARAVRPVAVVHLAPSRQLISTPHNQTVLVETARNTTASSTRNYTQIKTMTTNDFPAIVPSQSNRKFQLPEINAAC